MTDFLQITTSTGTRQDAEQIASELVSRRLAACVHVTGPVASTFRWQGKTETQEEWICTLKTSAEKLADVESLIAEIHPYELPELVATPIVSGSQRYLSWLKSELSI